MEPDVAERRYVVVVEVTMTTSFLGAGELAVVALKAIPGSMAARAVTAAAGVAG